MRHRINAHNGAEARRSAQPTGGTVHPEACLDMVTIAKTSAAARNRNTVVSGSQSLYNTAAQSCSTFVDSLTGDTALCFLNIAILQARYCTVKKQA
jgi:hypothetical protein